MSNKKANYLMEDGQITQLTPYKIGQILNSPEGVPIVAQWKGL